MIEVYYNIYYIVPQHMLVTSTVNNVRLNEMLI